MPRSSYLEIVRKTINIFFCVNCRSGVAMAESYNQKLFFDVYTAGLGAPHSLVQNRETCIAGLQL